MIVLQHSKHVFNTVFQCSKLLQNVEKWSNSSELPYLIQLHCSTHTTSDHDIWQAENWCKISHSFYNAMEGGIIGHYFSKYLQSTRIFVTFFPHSCPKYHGILVMSGRQKNKKTKRQKDRSLRSGKNYAISFADIRKCIFLMRYLRALGLHKNLDFFAQSFHPPWNLKDLTHSYFTAQRVLASRKLSKQWEKGMSLVW